MNEELYAEVVEERLTKGVDGLMNLWWLGDSQKVKVESTSCCTGLRSTPSWTKYLVSGLNGLLKQDSCAVEGLKDCPYTRKYINWLVNESPYAVTYVSKDVDKILDDGLFVQDASFDNRLVVNGCIAQRLLWEGPFKDLRYIWGMLYDRGVMGNTAFLACYLFQYDQASESIISGKVRYGHTDPGQGRLNPVAMANFIHNRVKWDRPSLAKEGSYHGLRDGWGEAGGYSDMMSRIQNVKPKVEEVEIVSAFSEGWEAIHPVKTEKENSYPAAALMNAVAEELIKIEKELA